MRTVRRLPSGCLFAATVVAVAACGSKPHPNLPPALPVQTVAHPAELAPVTPPPDPILERIARSSDEFERGQRELRLGHLSEARLTFDRALDLLLESPTGAFGDSRLSKRFTELSDRITALEAAALVSGDGFTELPYEPASIDELLSEDTLLSLTPAVPADLEATVQADLSATLHDVDIPLNPKVVSYVELFQGRLRDWFAASLQRGTRYLPMIQEVFKAEGVPLDLAFVPLVESAFKANALSRARAKGFWQFMRGTAMENGLTANWYVDERADPEKATLAAARYLKALADMFDGDWHLALASYNAGPGRLQRAMRRSGQASFWDLAATSRFLPRETREYVPMILAAIIVGKNPQQYGFDIEHEAPLAYERVSVPRAIDLRKVAEWTGTSIEEIRSLNPELRRLTTPARQQAYEVKLPVGTADAFQVRLAQADPSELAALKYHSVKRGETLQTVARRYGIRRNDLAEANDLSVRATVKPGQALLIPQVGTSPGSTPAASARTATASAARRADWQSGGDRQAKIVYRVRRGDSLYTIAQAFETTVIAIKGWNNLAGNRLMPGDTLTIYTPRGAAQN